MAQITKKTLGILLLSTAIAAAIGGGIWWAKKSPDKRSVGGDAIIANPNAPFAVSRCTARLHDDKPALAVMFSNNIDDTQKIDQLIEVVDLGDSKKIAQTASETNEKSKNTKNIIKGSWIVGDNPRVIVFPFVQAGHQYQINLGATLASTNQKTLEVSHSCEVKSDEMSPSFFFASKGTVLPAGLNGGLPVVTVNVPEVDVEFLRVSPNKIPKFINMVLGNQRSEEDGDSEYDGGYYDDNRNRLKGLTSGWQLNALKGIAESVYQNRFITNEAENTRKVSFLPVEKIKELKEPGVYVAVMRQPGTYEYEYQVTYFYVSDIGLHARRQVKQTDVFTTSLISGKEISGVELEVLNGDGKVLLSGKTDSDGHGVLAGLPDGARLLLAKRGTEMSMIALQEPGLDLAEFDIGGHLPRDTKLFVWSGRDLYRPGEKFITSVLVRSADGRALAPLPVQATIKKPSGDVVSSTIWQPNVKTPGYLRKEIALPPDAATGKWSLELRADPTAKRADAVYVFQVEEFLPERMKLTLKSEDAPLTGSDDFNVNVQGDYLYGAPAAGNRLLGSVAQERLRFALAKEWPGFIFGDFADDSKKTRAELSETDLDENGKTEVNVPYDSLCKFTNESASID